MKSYRNYLINCGDLLNVYLDSSARVNDEPGIQRWKAYKSRWLFVTKETSRTKSPPSNAWEGGREGNCILIPASLKLGVTMARSKTQIPGISFSNFYIPKFRSQKIRDLQTTDFL